MPNTIKIPHLNPIKFVSNARAFNVRQHIRHLDQALQSEITYNFQEPKEYGAKFNDTDPVYWQVVTNYGPVTCKLVNCDGDTVINGTVTAIVTDFYTAPETAWGCELDISGLDEGTYQAMFSVGSGSAKREFISEKIRIASNHSNTAMISYTHRENKAGAIFENGEIFYFRVEGLLTDFQPGSNDVVYEDQTADLVSITATPFRSWKFVAGNEEGIPDWVADRLNRIFGCDTVNIEDRQFTRLEGGKMDRNGDRDYPLSGWTIELRESESDETLDFSNDEELPLPRIYYGHQDNDDDPVDFSLYIEQSAYADIIIIFPEETDPKFFWMAHHIDAPTKNHWLDLDDAMNTGEVGGATDLFTTSTIDISGDDYTLYMSRYATGFTADAGRVKFFFSEPDIAAPTGLTAIYQPAYPAIYTTFTEPSPAADSYTIRVTGVTSGATDIYTGIMGSPHAIDLDAPAGENYLIAVRSEKDGNSSDWSADFLLEII